jgi:hypothetical protein
MPSKNMELVRSIVGEWERGDYRSAYWADPDIEVEVADGLAAGRIRGVARMAENERAFLNAWEGYRLEAEEYRELDAERVLVLVRHSGRGRTSGLDLAAMGARGAVLFRLSGEKVTRLALYWERDRALTDLGLTPEGA